MLGKVGIDTWVSKAEARQTLGANNQKLLPCFFSKVQ